MIVMKFGGTSLKNADKIKTVLSLVRERLHQKLVVVCSAHSGVTNMLIDAAQQALKHKNKFKSIQDRHYQIIDDLGLDRSLIQPELDELEELIRGIYLVRELTPRTKDHVMSFGERMSCKIVAAYFTREGLPAEAVNAYDLGFVTDSNFGNAGILPETEVNIRKAVKQCKRLPVVTGFIAKNRKGDITTIGRSGSDTTASVIGSALGVKEIQIWTDVDGIMSADPSFVPAAKPIPKMTFEEAAELAYFGAEVVHPQSVLSAVKKRIPVRVLNTYKPEYEGSVIQHEVRGDKSIVKSIAYKEDQILFHVVSSRMLMQHGFMSQLFEVFARHSVVVDVVSTSEVSVSLTVPRDENIEEVVKELSFFSEVTVQKKKAVVAVVGQNIRNTIGVPAVVFDILRRENVPVDVISVGASKVNISFVIDNEDIHKAVAALHYEFFESGKKLNVKPVPRSKRG